MGPGAQDQTRADAERATPETAHALAPDSVPSVPSLAAEAGLRAPALALQRLIGNRAMGWLLAGAPGAPRLSQAGARAALPRPLARTPTLAARVQAAADKGDWKTVGTLLSSAPMGALLDAA